METADIDYSTKIRPGGRWSMPARYVFASVLMLGSFLNIMVRTSLPMAITAMVITNTSHTTTSDVTDFCYAGNTSRQSSNNSTSGVFDWDEVTQSTVLTASSYGMLATCVVGARFAELWSRKLMNAVCTLVFGVCFLLLPVAADWSVVAIVVSQVVAGLLSGPIQPVQMAMTASWFPPQERQKLGGITFSALSLATMTSNVLTGKLVDTLGWQFVFYLFSSLVIVWVALWMVFVHDSPDDHPSISEDERTYITENTRKDESQTVSRLPWKDILLSSPLWAHIVMGLPACWVALLFVNSLPTYMTNVLHFSSTEAGYFLALPQFSMWLCTIIFGWLSQWVRRKKYLGQRMTYIIFNAIATLGPAATFVSIPLVECDVATIVSLLVLIMCCSSAYVGGSQLNHMDLAINYAGTLSGLSATVLGVVGILLPTITGVVTNNQQTLSAWNKVFYVAAGVNVVPFFIYLIFGSVEEQTWNRSQHDSSKDSSVNTMALAMDTESSSNKKS